ncbi:MAG: DEAD/DEAH box helicase, partial [Pirellulaceae bacterium]|nr:DEAD/DEAH box helicase [Pirellulaceae bacterium]
MNFESLSLSKSLLRSIEAVGYNEPTPIQEQTIPHALAGKDVLGCAQTGTGKTAAFTLPTLQRLMESANRPTT